MAKKILIKSRFGISENKIYPWSLLYNVPYFRDFKSKPFFAKLINSEYRQDLLGVRELQDHIVKNMWYLDVDNIEDIKTWFNKLAIVRKTKINKLEADIGFVMINMHKQNIYSLTIFVVD